MKKFKIFVYGTLMEGYHNYDKYLNGHVISTKNAHIKGKMYHLPQKGCPAVIEGDEDIYGQVFEVEDDENNTVSKSVDDLEKYFNGSDEVMYERKLKTVFYENGECEDIGVYIFVNNKYLNSNKVIDIKSGNWHEFNKK